MAQDSSLSADKDLSSANGRGSAELEEARRQRETVIQELRHAKVLAVLVVLAVVWESIAPLILVIALLMTLPAEWLKWGMEKGIAVHQYLNRQSGRESRQ